MAVEIRPVHRQAARKNSENDDSPLKYQLVVNGQKVTPTSADITIYANGDDEELVDAESMTVSGTLMTYALDTTDTDTWPVGKYKAVVTVTYSSVEYVRHFMFEVVTYLFDMAIGFDQLVSLDDGIRGMMHDGDATFKNLITACTSVIRAQLERKVVKDKRLLPEMIIDHSGLDVAAQFYMLHRIWMNKGNTEKAEAYKTDYQDQLDAVLSTVSYDTQQGGDEPAQIGQLDETRFET